MFFDNKRVVNYSLVSLPVQSAGTYTNFNFPDQPQLRGKKVERVTAYSGEAIPRTPDGGVVAQSGDISQCFLVLYIDGREDIKIALPHLCTLSSVTGGTVVNYNSYIPLNDVNIIWEKSYVKAPNGLTLVANSAFLFGVFYK